MKKLNTISMLFGMVIMLAAFMASCTKDQNVETTPINDISTEEISEIFTFPEEINNLSDEELATYLDGLTEDEIDALQIPIIEGEIESRGCGSWSTWYSYCRTYSSCPGGKKSRLGQKRWCGPPTSGGYEYRWIWGSNCCPY